jgi:hypothetical protein
MGNDDRFLEVLKANGLQPEVWQIDQLLELSKKTSNHIKHFNKDIEGLAAAIGDVGFKNFIFINKKGDAISAGNGRILAASRAGKTELPVLRITDLSPAKTRKFALGDNKLRSDKWDEQVLVEDLFFIKNSNESIEYLDFGKYADQLKEDMAAAEEKIAQAIQEIDAGEPYRAPGGPVGGLNECAKGYHPGTGIDDEMQIAPVDPNNPEISLEEIKNGDSQQGDLVFPSEPEWGVPLLSMSYQAEKIITPVVKWGEISQKKKMNGIWHFYIADYKFETLYYNDPNAPLLSHAYACVEPNYSIRSQTPRAWAMGQTFKKRWLARYWQSKGMRIFVDLNVRLDMADINMLGVPREWKAFAVRGYNNVVEHIDESFKFAASWAKTNEILFLVIGGGKDVQAICAEKQWTWIPERMQVVHNAKFAGMDGLDAKVSPDQYLDIGRR